VSFEEAADRIVICLRVDRQRGGMRADRFLAERIPRLSRSRASAIVAAGDLRRDGQPLKPSSLVRTEEALELWRTPPAEPPVPRDCALIHDDGDLLVIDKPAGLAIHPTARYFRTTLTQHLRGQVAAGELAGPVPRPCHRLDRETSGVILTARSRELERRLKQAFSRNALRKTYWALVEGQVDRERFTIDTPLAVGQSTIRIKMCPTPGAVPALTRFERMRELDGRTLLACFPETGRTHQIRAHLALAGHPVVGDKIYGIQGEGWFLRWAAGGVEAAPIGELGWPRHCLHAHAISAEGIPGLGWRFEAPWPDDLPACGEG